MSSSVCAIFVTCNHKERLRTCLRAVLSQTRPVNRILIIDNASTDGTPALLESEFPQLSRITLPEYAGESGGLAAGMRWTHCNKFDWTWTLNDRIEVAPECLATMLSFENQADLIQIDAQAGTESCNPGPLEWAKTEICDFDAALIGKTVTETIGLPDERYFYARYDTAYGYLAAHKTRSILLHYPGIRRIVPAEPLRNRATFYLAIRNLFLNREHLAKNGLPPRSHTFFVQTLGVLFNQLGEAAATSADTVLNARAAIDGLRDGIHKKFDRIPRI